MLTQAGVQVIACPNKRKLISVQDSDDPQTPLQGPGGDYRKLEQAIADDFLHVRPSVSFVCSLQCEHVSLA